ncbi:MAG: TA system VapC family ribonuclease toxin [Burkholderiaceae bacterium]|nr:PIN domain-containing protein [Burkholderiales bacterium]
MTPDVNVLVAASRADHPHHQPALRWLRQAMAQAAAQIGKAELGLLGTVVASFLRLVTHPRVFAVPTPAADAVAFVDALLGASGVRMLSVKDEWPRLRALCLAQQLSGNDLPDAWIAASVLQTRETLATFDRDFLRLLDPKHLVLLRPDP